MRRSRLSAKPPKARKNRRQIFDSEYDLAALTVRCAYLYGNICVIGFLGTAVRKHNFLYYSSIIVFCGYIPVAAQSPLPASTPPAAKPAEKPADQPAKEQSKLDLFDFTDKARSKASMGEEQPYLDLDETIKVRVEPIVRSAVVDRVVEPTTIYVKAPGSTKVEVYLEPVDAPFCGKSVGQPRLIGKSIDGRRGFPVNWGAVEKHKYVKLYALVYKSDGQKRSRSIDLCMGGLRFEAQASSTPTR